MNLSDYGARWYDASVARWWSIDPLADLFPINSWSQYTYVRNNPVKKIDVDGNWDIDVHVFGDRSMHGYGVAILKDMYGTEIYRFTVRVEGLHRDRMKTKGDTPTGVYDIPNKNPWIKEGGKKRGSYGANPRLSLTAKSGEIKASGRSLIRIHGGRQETQDKYGNWVPDTYTILKQTEGCMRCYDSDIVALKDAVEKLEASNSKEYGGQLNVVDDLINKDGFFIIPGQQPLQILGRDKLPSSGGTVPEQSAIDVIWNFFFNSRQSSQEKKKEPRA